MRYIVIIISAIVLLLIQSSLSKRRSSMFLFILPLLSVLTGLVYQSVSSTEFYVSALYPFLILAACLLLFSFIKRLDHRKKELEVMKSQDL